MLMLKTFSIKMLFKNPFAKLIIGKIISLEETLQHKHTTKIKWHGEK